MVTLNISLSDGTIEIEADHDQIDQVAASAIRLIEALSATSARQIANAPDRDVAPTAAQAPAATTLVSAETRQKPRGKKGAKGKNWTHLPGLLSDDDWKKFKLFFDAKSPKSQNEQVAVIALKLGELLSKDGIDGNEMHTAFRALGVKTPLNLTGVFGNMAGLGFGHMSDGKFYLDFKGKQLVEHELPKAKAKPA